MRNTLVKGPGGDTGGAAGQRPPLPVYRYDHLDGSPVPRHRIYAARRDPDGTRLPGRPAQPPGLPPDSNLLPERETAIPAEAPPIPRADRRGDRGLQRNRPRGLRAGVPRSSQLTGRPLSQHAVRGSPSGRLTEHQLSGLDRTGGRCRRWAHAPGRDGVRLQVVQLARRTEDTRLRGTMTSTSCYHTNVDPPFNNWTCP